MSQQGKWEKVSVADIKISANNLIENKCECVDASTSPPMAKAENIEAQKATCCSKKQGCGGSEKERLPASRIVETNTMMGLLEKILEADFFRELKTTTTETEVQALLPEAFHILITNAKVIIKNSDVKKLLETKYLQELIPTLGVQSLVPIEDDGETMEENAEDIALFLYFSEQVLWDFFHYPIVLSGESKEVDSNGRHRVCAAQLFEVPTVWAWVTSRDADS